MKRILVTVCALVLLIPILAFGQAETTGRISVRVVDEQGSPIADARVTLISSAMQGERVNRTGAHGEFLAALLPVGAYAVSAAAPGKQTVQVSLRLGVGQQVPLEIVMRPGEKIVEKVTVHGTATPLETTYVGENLNYEREVEELPIASRNILNVASYAPNVRKGAWVPDVLVGVTQGMVISGAPVYESIIQLDGADISDPYYGQGLLLYLEDAVEDVQVMTSGISARYGRFSGGVINTITKSGGNEFDGTVRVELNKESWNSTTPFGEELSNELNEVYQATLGGYVLKDKLWFFAGGRSVPTRIDSATTITTGESFRGETDDQRWQLKLRGAPGADHVIEATYLDRDFDTTAGGFTVGDLLAANAVLVLEPMSLFTLGYQGIFGPKSFLDVRASSKQHSTLCCSNGALRSWLGDWVQGVDYNGVIGNQNDETQRDADSASIAFTHVFTGDARGTHTLETGTQFVRSTTASHNPTVSPTGFGMGMLAFGSTPVAELGPNPGELVYNLGGDVYNVRLQAIPVSNLEADIDNYALYAQDSWQLGKWRFDAGLRWESYDVSTFREDLERSAEGWAPRLGVTRNLSPKWQVQTTWGRYQAKFHDILLAATALIWNIPHVQREYAGPAMTGITADEVEAVLRDDSQWGVLTTVRDPDQPTWFLADDIDLPYTDEFTLGVRAGLPKDQGSFSATYINRDYEDLIVDFVGDFGFRTLEDPFTGDPLLDGTTGDPARFDVLILDNTSQARRRYEAFAVTWDYRPGALWNLGGNWTYSKLTGNQSDTSTVGESPIGTYERSRPEEAAAPNGYLPDDSRHRVQAWGNYRFDLERAGALALGAVGRYETGRNWSRTAFLPLADDPIYNNDTGFYEHFFDGRGNNRFDDRWTLDLSARWQARIHKRLDAWVKATIVNVFDNDALVAYDTTGTAVDDGTGNLVWEPVGSCGPGDAPSVDCSGFGRIRSQDDFQVPRSYLFTVGLSF